MNNMVPWLTVIGLIFVVAIGAWKKRNCGILALGVAFILGFFILNENGVAISSVAGGSRVIYQGMSYALIARIIFVSMLFGIAAQNGTLAVIAEMFVRLVRGRRRLIPVVLYVMITIICYVGAGGHAVNLILIPLACIIAVREGCDLIMMAIVCYLANCGGSGSPFSSIGLVVVDVAESVGITVGQHNGIASVVCFTISAALFYFAMGGWKIPNAPTSQEAKAVVVDKYQKVTLAVIFVFTVMVVAKFEIMTCAAVAISVLLMVHGEKIDEKKLIQNVPWGTVVLIMGMSMFISTFAAGGGVQLLVDGLMKIMTPRLAPAMMGLVGSLLSAVSSAAGVVYPTVIPTVPAIASALNINPIPLVVGIGLGGCASSISPMSDGGAMVMGAMAQSDPNFDNSKAFNKMLIAALVNVALFFVYGLLGLFSL